MKRFNYEEHLEKFQKNFKLSLTIFIILLLTFVGLFLLGIFTSNYKDRYFYMITYSIILSVIAILSSIVLIFYVLNYHKQIKQIYYILGGYLVKIQGQLIEDKGIITTVNGRKGREFVVKDDDKTYSIYLDLLFDENLFHIGDELSLKVSESFIIQYEVRHV